MPVDLQREAVVKINMINDHVLENTCTVMGKNMDKYVMTKSPCSEIAQINFCVLIIGGCCGFCLSKMHQQ